MKLVVRVKLVADAKTASALGSTLRACNEAANFVSQVAFEKGEFSKPGLQKLIYADLKGRGLGAQAAIRTIAKVVDAYATLKANIRAGNLGRPGSPRRVKAESKPIEFRPEAAQPYDDRMVSWWMGKRTVSIWTTSGRLKDIRFVGNEEQLALLAAHRKGESDLLCRDGEYYLVATLDLEDPEIGLPSAFIGVDMGVVNIATRSDGVKHGGRGLQRHRKRMRDLRAKLQKKGTKSAKRRLKLLSGREKRRATDLNHCISKSIVVEAERTGHGIAIEDLRGIRDRVRLKRPTRAAVHSWAFAQLGQFLTYKAQRQGVMLVTVDPRNTSRECSDCHHIDKRNRPSQAVFRCGMCGFADHADCNASSNISARGWWKLVCGVQSTAPELKLLV
jgi:IS605 OrfB family transposase